MEPKEVTITISGPNHSGKSTMLSFIAMVLQCLESPTSGKSINFVIDPSSQTLQENSLFTDEQLTSRLTDMIDNNKLRVVLREVPIQPATSTIIGGEASNKIILL